MIGILHNIRSKHNVGSIFRTADAAGIKKLYLCGITPAPQDQWGRENRALTKVSLGAEQSVSWERMPSTSELLDKLKTQGYTICAIEQSPQSVSLASISFSKYNKCALVLGNEVDGIESNILDKADIVIEIPMRGKKESLNVAVAFGIVAYHSITP